MNRAAIKLATFTVFTIVVTFWLASVIGKLTPFSDTYEIRAVFSDATGVLKGDDVKIAGVPIGKVTGSEVSGGEAVVTMEIASDREIPDNSLANIRFLNLLGQRVIDIVPAEEPSSTPMEDGFTIPVTRTKPALDLSVVFNNLRPLIQSTNPEDLNAVARAVLDIFKGRERDVAALLGNLGEVTETLAGRDQRLARLVGDLDGVARVLNGRSGELRSGLRDFTRFMEGLEGLTPEIESTVVHLEGASRKLGGVVSRNRANLDQELADLRAILDIVNENLGPLDRVARNLKEVLLATARSQSYGKWYNLYLVNFCPETGSFGFEFPNNMECDV